MKTLKWFKSAQAEQRRDRYWSAELDRWIDGGAQYQKLESDCLSHIEALYNRGIRMAGGDNRTTTREAARAFDARATKFEDTITARLQSDLKVFYPQSIYTMERLTQRKLS